MHEAASVHDLMELASKIGHTIRQIQQSAILVMVFGIAVWCMLEADIFHQIVLILYTICSFILLRWGIGKL